MQNISIKRARVNLGALDEQLRDQFGPKLVGISTSNGEVIAHLTDDASTTDIANIKNIVRDHDPLQLTQTQLKQNARQQELQQNRSQFTQAIKPENFSGESATIQILVNRLRWLEQEIRDLRGIEEA